MPVDLGRDHFLGETDVEIVLVEYASVKAMATMRYDDFRSRPVLQILAGLVPTVPSCDRSASREATAHEETSPDFSSGVALLATRLGRAARSSGLAIKRHSDQSSSTCRQSRCSSSNRPRSKPLNFKRVHRLSYRLRTLLIGD